MTLSSRSAIAIHVLTYLARWGEQGLQTSTAIAESLDTSPVIVRRVLGRLRTADLVISAEGPDGGYRLARPASGISLLDAHAAVEPDVVLGRHPHPPSQSCLVGRHIQGVLEEEFVAAERAMTERLAATTIADLQARIVGLEPVSG